MHRHLRVPLHERQLHETALDGGRPSTFVVPQVNREVVERVGFDRSTQNLKLSFQAGIESIPGVLDGGHGPLSHQ